MQYASFASDGRFKALPVAIIEPQRLFAPYLAQMLSEAGFSIVTSLDSLELDEVGRVEPAIVFADVDFIEGDAADAIRQLRVAAPEATICAYTGHSDAWWCGVYARAGANCIISKAASPAEIIDGLAQALQVGMFVGVHFESRRKSRSG